MSINGIGTYQISANALYAGQNANTVQGSGDVDRSRITPPTTGRTGLFTDTITQTLFQIGVTPTAANVATGAPPTNSQQQALNAFVQNLFGALQESGTPTAGTGGKPAPAIRKDGRPLSPSSLSDTQQDASLDSQIQSLAQQLNSSPATQTEGNLAALQQSFQDLISTQGGNTNASLGNFLQALSQNLQDVPPAGSLISTSA
ncbi:MAG: hypothetical protein JO002_02340 [Burkholderiaceae bacterium]|nr:hypothetical protein [Burkholderiaceae bacterium]